jgi:hypothetical protein
MTVIYVWLSLITVMQIIQWIANAHTRMKARELEKVFEKMDQLTNRQAEGFKDSFNKVQELHNRVADILLQIQRKQKND